MACRLTFDRRLQTSVWQEMQSSLSSLLALMTCRMSSKMREDVDVETWNVCVQAAAARTHLRCLWAVVCIGLRKPCNYMSLATWTSRMSHHLHQPPCPPSSSQPREMHSDTFLVSRNIPSII